MQKQIGSRLLTFANLKNYINEELEKVQSKKVATVQEVMEYLTSVVRGESESEVVVIEGTGDGCSDARTMYKKPDEKEKLKAAELLGKRYGIFSEKMDLSIKEKEEKKNAISNILSQMQSIDDVQC